MEVKSAGFEKFISDKKIVWSQRKEDWGKIFLEKKIWGKSDHRKNIEDERWSMKYAVVLLLLSCLIEVFLFMQWIKHILVIWVSMQKSSQVKKEALKKSVTAVVKSCRKCIKNCRPYSLSILFISSKDNHITCTQLMNKWSAWLLLSSFLYNFLSLNHSLSRTSRCKWSV